MHCCCSLLGLLTEPWHQLASMPLLKSMHASKRSPPAVLWASWLNRGTNFGREEREQLHIEGLLPPVVESLELQVIQLRFDQSVLVLRSMAAAVRLPLPLRPPPLHRWRYCCCRSCKMQPTRSHTALACCSHPECPATTAGGARDEPAAVNLTRSCSNLAPPASLPT